MKTWTQFAALRSCLLTRTTGHGDPNPAHRVWRDVDVTA
jgi:hypothetical protein